MDAPCTYGISRARLRVCGTQSWSRRGRDKDFTSSLGYREAGVSDQRGRCTGEGTGFL